MVGCCRQEEPHCASVSFDRHAANVFQTYVSSALAFSIKRGGILYGNKDEEGNVMVHAIYEPPQVIHTQGEFDSLPAMGHSLQACSLHAYLHVCLLHMHAAYMA